MEKVAVLLSTYNGETFLSEQISSILAQIDVEVEIYIRDDGSTDNTAAIIEQYSNSTNQICFLNNKNGENIGVKSSFLELLNYAYSNSDSGFFAFSDQDDYWLPNKLERATKTLLREADSKPSLYFSRKTFTDKKLDIIGTESTEFINDFFSLFHPTGASGCTMVFNREMAKLASRIKPKYVDLHDQWMFRLAICCGVTICFDKDSFIYYRQHQNNLYGMESCQEKHNWKDFFKPQKHKLQLSLCEIFDNYQDKIDNQTKKMLSDVRNYNKSLVSKYALAFNPLALKRGFKTSFFWMISVFRGTI